MGEQYLLEHRESRLAPARCGTTRYRIALAIAAAEGILVLAGVMPWWLVVAPRARCRRRATLGWGREHESADVRVVTWTAAVSQLLVVLVPVLAGALVILAAVAVVLLAAVGARGAPARPSVAATGSRDTLRLPIDGAWPSGKATGFGPVIPGSNPGAPAIVPTRDADPSSQQS